MNTSWKQICTCKSHNIKQVQNTKTSHYHITATPHYYRKTFAATATFKLYTLQHQQFKFTKIRVSWNGELQCWTWSGLQIAIQPDSALQNQIRIGLDFEKNSTRSDMDIQTALITAVKCLIRVFFGYKPDWIKYFDRSTGLGSDRITERKTWTGFGF